jgi:NAD(P)-dependent dehydrogenase (short-subunit alcohol dehydrogenase family)
MEPGLKPLDLTGRRALVTGGNRGIGAATVLALARAGATVTYTARSAASLAEGPAGPGITGVVADATDRAATVALLAQGFDIVVNNAGIITPIGRLDCVAIDDWEQNIQINLISAFHVTQQAIVHRPASGVTVVHLSSGAARNAMEGWSAYCAGKAGLAMLTQSVHLEFADHGVRVFGFAPGVVDTGMQGSIRASGINPVSRIPRENLAPAEVPAYGIAWLATAEADPFAGKEVDVRTPEFRAASGLEPSA